MNKFRKMLFNLFFGCELVEYMEILRNWHETIGLAQNAIDMNNELIDRNKRVTDLAQEISNQCERLLERCKEMKANETLD